MLKKFTVLALAASAVTLAAAPAYAAKTLEAVKQRGMLSCGVGNTIGMSAADSHGNWSGISVDFCRAVAAAVLGDPKKVRWVPLTSQQRFTALQSGEVDVLSRETTWTLSRDASLGIQFTGVTYYDGQGFMVPAKSKITSPAQLKGATVCTTAGTTTEKNLTDYSRSHNLNIKPLVFEKSEAVEAAYFSGRCDALTSDASDLASTRRTEARNPADHVILSELISKEPLGPAVRRGDDEWATIVKWVGFGLVDAEENGITQANVDKLAAESQSPNVLRILGKSEDTGTQLGLDKDWMVRVIKAVGNYGEIFDRNLGAKTPLNISRGLNNLWSKGGIMYAPPIR